METSALLLCFENDVCNEMPDTREGHPKWEETDKKGKVLRQFEWMTICRDGDEPVPDHERDVHELLRKFNPMHVDIVWRVHSYLARGPSNENNFLLSPMAARFSDFEGKTRSRECHTGEPRMRPARWRRRPGGGGAAPWDVCLSLSV